MWSVTSGPAAVRTDRGVRISLLATDKVWNLFMEAAQKTYLQQQYSDTFLNTDKDSKRTRGNYSHMWVKMDFL